MKTVKGNIPMWSWARHSLAVLVIVAAGAFLGACAAGGHGGKTKATAGDGDAAAASANRSGTTKVVRWNVVANHGRRLVIGAFVPFCGGKQKRPWISQVIQRRSNSRVTLTMHVHFPSHHGSCVGYDIGVKSVVRLSRSDLRLPVYDGATRPPVLRIRR